MNNIKKHAYLFMAHGDLSVLGKSLQLLDNERNDMYIHIDKKTPFDKIKLTNNVKRSKVFFIEQMNVYWGGYSQIDCELKLLKALIKEKYTYYHLLSGSDLPLKNQDEIHDFFERNHGKEFIHFESSSIDNNAKDRVKYYFPLQEKLKENRLKYFMQHFLLKYIQKAVGINRLEKISLKFKKGLIGLV